MKANAVISYNFTYDEWYLTSGPDSTFTWRYGSSGRTLAINGGGNGTYLVTEESLRVGSQVKNVKDRDGNGVFQEGGIEYPMYVANTVPQFDFLGRVVAYRNNVTRAPSKSLLSALTGGLDA